MNDDLEDFYILIGHRRFAASEGILFELPCVIAEGLTKAEQVSIMLCENMQRSDLTFLEQAHGFQLMMDLGDTVETISQKTGFSESTVKHRLEIAKLKQKSIDAAMENFQPTIGDYIELEKVKDIKERNKILEEAESSSDIRYSVEAYVEEQNRKKNSKKYLELINSLGWKESKEYFYSYGPDPKWEEIKALSKIDLEKEYDDSAIQAFAKNNTRPVFYRYDGYYITFAFKAPQKKEKEKKKTKQELLEEARKKNTAILNDTRTVICDRYYEFIYDIDDVKEFKELSDKQRIKFMERLFEVLVDLESYLSTFEHTYNIRSKNDLKDLKTDYEGMPDALQRLMIHVWAALASSHSNNFVEWNFTKNMKVLKGHQQLYSTLYFFGFRLNDEYKAIIEGKSDLYTAKV
jgi:ParB family chromosome partitioning protein